MARISTIEELGQADPMDVDGRDLVDLRPTDVVITPFAKSGTTWMQQIVHTLRTRGDMDFDDISRMIPFIDANHLVELDLNAEQRANPRAFKTHLTWELCPQGGRYINVVRDPVAAAMSMFNFAEGSIVERGVFTPDEVTEHRFLAHRAYYRHLRSWWARRNDDDVLYLVYERMLREPEATIRRVADFIDIELDDELLAITLEHSSREFMLQHSDRFDDAMISKVLGEGTDLRKVTSGSTTEGFSDRMLGLLADAWRDEVEDPLGFASYDELVAAVD